SPVVRGVPPGAAPKGPAQAEGPAQAVRAEPRRPVVRGAAAGHASAEPSRAAATRPTTRAAAAPTTPTSRAAETTPTTHATPTPSSGGVPQRVTDQSAGARAKGRDAERDPEADALPRPAPVTPFAPVVCAQRVHPACVRLPES